MSFIQENFMPDRGAFNGSLTPACFGVHRYSSNFDVFGDIESLDYFPPYFGLDSNSVRSNDYLQVQDAQRSFRQYLISLDEFGDVTVYSSTGNLIVPATIHGLDPVTTYPIDLRLYLRTGTIHLCIPAFSLAAPNIVDVCTILSIPTGYAPISAVSPINEYIFVTNNNAQNYGLVIVDSTGKISIGLTDVTSAPPIKEFTTGQPMGWITSTYSWAMNIQ